MISVVIATYNGEKFILEQLESIRTQTRVADEVLICDDCSTDATRELCADFIEKYDLKNWCVVKNSYNFGYYNNFMTGLKGLHGDILILCDQDDIWCPNKIEVIEKTMHENPDILSLTTTFSRFDNGGNLLDKHVRHPHCCKDGLKKISWREFFSFYAYLGMSMAIRSSLLSEIRMEKSNISHDIVLNMYAVKMNGLYHLDKVLTKRRSYPESTSNDEIQRERNEQFKGNVQLQYLSRKIQLFVPQQFNFHEDTFTKKMDKFRENCQKRYDYINNKKIFAWLKNLVHINLYESFEQYLKDFYWILK